MAINIKNADVDALMLQLGALTGQGPIEIVKAALEREYRELRRQRRQKQLIKHLAGLQAKAIEKDNHFDIDSLYNADGWPQ